MNFLLQAAAGRIGETVPEVAEETQEVRLKFEQRTNVTQWLCDLSLSESRFPDRIVKFLFCWRQEEKIISAEEVQEVESNFWSKGEDSKPELVSHPM